MIEDVKLAVECKVPVHLYRRQGGMLPTEDGILANVEKVFNLASEEV